MDSFHSRSTLSAGGKQYEIYRLGALDEQGISTKHLPFSLRILLENLLRTEDGRNVRAEDIRTLASWNKKSKPERDIAFTPSRVLMQDFTGVPAVVDLAAMRDAMKRLGGDQKLINPLQPAELVIDHSVQVDEFGSPKAFDVNALLEFQRNKERYAFLRWGQTGFRNLAIVPPDTGIVHQVNLEYLARVVFVHKDDEGGKRTVYPDTLVGTDSHTTMVNGLGVLGWGVGGIEAEAAMLGQPVSMLIPLVVGVKLTGRLREGATATDLVLTITEMLRKHGVVGKFVEFFGPGISELPLADRATIANMAPEYGATCGIFPVDEETLKYLRLTGRPETQVQLVETYFKEQGLFHTADAPEPAPTSVEGRFGVEVDPYLGNGSIVIAAITSCTNTSNPYVMVAAGLLAKKAVEKGLSTPPWVKTSLAPGSRVVTDYYNKAGLLPYLDKLRFQVVGYGCTTFLGNSGPLPSDVSKSIEDNGLVAVSVLSGNRNFEGRISPEVRANYLMSPPLVVAYALAGHIGHNFDTEPLGHGKNGDSVYLRDIWPTQEEVAAVVNSSIDSEMFRKQYSTVTDGDNNWRSLKIPVGETYGWEPDSTYIRKAPYFDGMAATAAPVEDIHGARVLAVLGDSVTTDHISPAGSIKLNGPAGKYLTEHGVKPSEFNSYGSRRGNHEVMVRGTFANVRLRKKLAPGTEGGVTRL